MSMPRSSAARTFLTAGRANNQRHSKDMELHRETGRRNSKIATHRRVCAKRCFDASVLARHSTESPNGLHHKTRTNPRNTLRSVRLQTWALMGRARHCVFRRFLSYSTQYYFRHFVRAGTAGDLAQPPPAYHKQNCTPDAP